MRSTLSDVIKAANLAQRLEEVEEARRLIQESDDPDADEEQHVGRSLLIRESEKLRQAMFEVGQAVARDPDYGPETQVNAGTFYDLFDNLDTPLLREPAAKEGFRAGVASVRKV